MLAGGKQYCDAGKIILKRGIAVNNLEALKALDKKRFLPANNVKSINSPGQRPTASQTPGYRSSSPSSPVVL